jgi:hypothetical protein
LFSLEKVLFKGSHMVCFRFCLAFVGRVPVTFFKEKHAENLAPQNMHGSYDAGYCSFSLSRGVGTPAL